LYQTLKSHPAGKKPPGAFTSGSAGDDHLWHFHRVSVKGFNFTPKENKCSGYFRALLGLGETDKLTCI